MDIEKTIKLKLATGIMNNMNRLTEIWTEIDHYTKYGALKAKGEPLGRKIAEMSRSELISFCWNIHPTIAKLKKKITNEKNELKKAALQSELNIRLAELDELKKIRDGEGSV
jgi:hypoxanthine phosphoribosyltransferase